MHREMHSYKKCQFSLVFVKVPKFLMHVCISIFFFKRGIIFGASKSYDHFFFCQQPYHGSSKSHRFRQRKAFGSKFDNQNGFPFSVCVVATFPHGTLSPQFVLTDMSGTEGRARVCAESQGWV